MSRELRLLRRFAPLWTVGVHPLLKKCRFRRGFPEYVHLHLLHFLHHRRQLLSAAPIRDISLTGLWRAPEHLVNRVADCEEWASIESLKIHHQGPHHEADGRVLPLLESPHLTRLKALSLGVTGFSADDRRQFERLAVLGRVEELTVPATYSDPDDPGLWLPVGVVVDYPRLRSLSIPIKTPECLARWTRQPFWNSLTALSLRGDNRAPDVLDAFAWNVPPGLRRLTLHAPGNVIASDSFDRLAALPLEEFHSRSVSPSADTLRHLLSRESRWNLRRLTLNVPLSCDHLRAIADCPAADGLEYLSFRDSMDGGDVPPGVIRPGLRELVVTDNAYLRRLIPAGRPFPGLRRIDVEGFGTEAGVPTPAEFPDIVSLHLDGTCREAVARAGDYPLLGRLDVTEVWNSCLTDDDMEALSRLGERLWVTFDDLTGSTPPQQARCQLAPERFPPLDDGR